MSDLLCHLFYYLFIITNWSKTGRSFFTIYKKLPKTQISTIQTNFKNQIFLSGESRQWGLWERRDEGRRSSWAALEPGPRIHDPHRQRRYYIAFLTTFDKYITDNEFSYQGPTKVSSPSYDNTKLCSPAYISPSRNSCTNSSVLIVLCVSAFLQLFR